MRMNRRSSQVTLARAAQQGRRRRVCADACMPPHARPQAASITERHARHLALHEHPVLDGPVPAAQSLRHPAVVRSLVLKPTPDRSSSARCRPSQSLSTARVRQHGRCASVSMSAPVRACSIAAGKQRVHGIANHQHKLAQAHLRGRLAQQLGRVAALATQLQQLGHVAVVAKERHGRVPPDWPAQRSNSHAPPQ